MRSQAYTAIASPPHTCVVWMLKNVCIGAQTMLVVFIFIVGIGIQEHWKTRGLAVYNIQI